MVTVDVTGVINTDTTGDGCTNGIEENAFYGWVAEPTNVHAEFIGDRTTRVTWSDQLGIEGEIYHIWHTTYRVSGAQFVENQTMMYLGTVGDGIGSFDVEVPDDEEPEELPKIRSGERKSVYSKNNDFAKYGH